MEKRHRHEYSEADDLFIAQNYGKMPTQEIAKVIGTSKSGISHRAQRMGNLVKHPRKPTLYDGTDIPGEEWRDVVGFEGFYKVSNLGRVRSVERVQNGRKKNGYIIRPSHDACGYEMLELRNGTFKKRLSVHRIVAKAFIPNPDNLPQVNHIDEVRDHNSADNLEWCTIEYNQNYGNRRARISESSTGERNARHILTEKDVIEIRETYIPGDREFGVRPLSEKYGVSYVTITKIIGRKIWKHIA